MALSRNLSLLLYVFPAVFGAPPGLHAQENKNAEPDVLILQDDEKLVGHLVRATGSSVMFKSDMLGEVTVDWSKIKELHSAQRFAVIGKGVKLRKRGATGSVPQGTIAVADQTIAVQPGGDRHSRTAPVGEVAYLIDDATFQRAVLQTPGILRNWRGAVTAGASLVDATQRSRTFTGGVHFVRAIPAENWLEARNRTILGFTTSYGKLTQPGSPELKTAIYHADAERDQYFTPRVYAFGQMMLDHNFSQGLDLQQDYGGGLGWTAVQQSHQTLDVKASANYVDQQFGKSAGKPTPGESLLGSTFAERYQLRFLRGMLFNQQLSVTPTWNNTNAWSAAGNTSLTIPVYKRLSLSLAAIDTFLNNSAPGFRKNSFQFTTGLTYTLP